MTRHQFLIASASILVPFLTVAQAPVSSMQFSDVPASAWFAPYVREASSWGIVEGYRDRYDRLTGRFAPEASVTVAEALKIVLESAGYDRTLGRGQGHWAADYLSIALGSAFQITRGVSLDLDRPATRAEIAGLVADAFRIPLPATSTTPFDDVRITDPYATSINVLESAGILGGDTTTEGVRTYRFRPRDLVNRAEMVKVALEARVRYGTPGAWWLPSSSSSSSASSTGPCMPAECGVGPLLPNWQCLDGSIGGPFCERLSDGRCGWVLRQCPVSSSRSSQAVQTHEVTYDASLGFSPSTLVLSRGDRVRFRNAASYPLSIFSNPHPAHTDLTSLNLSSQIPAGASVVLTFLRTGTFGFHSEQDLRFVGTVIVQ